jgi:hypothetical protein
MNRRRVLILVAVAALTYVLTTSVFPRGSSTGQKVGNAFEGGAFSSAVSFLAIIALIISAVRIMHFYRARAMRRFASRWGLRYVGPTAPPQWWWNTSRPEIPSPLPGWMSRLGISQAWNIIEGKSDSTSLFVFDGVLGTVRSQPCTYIACHTEQSPFEMSTSAEPVIQMHGWTVLHGVWFLWFCWLMGIGRLDKHFSNLSLALLSRNVSR